jgi:hypothetical protein
MGKSRTESPAARRARLASVRAELAGPALLAALAPVAERVKASVGWQHRGGRAGLDDNLKVMVTMAEAEAIVAAVEKANQYGGVRNEPG